MSLPWPLSLVLVFAHGLTLASWLLPFIHIRRLNNCVGRSNYRYFVALLLSTFFMTSLQLGLSAWFATMYHSGDSVFKLRGAPSLRCTCSRNRLYGSFKLVPSQSDSHPSRVAHFAPPLLTILRWPLVYALENGYHLCSNGWTWEQDVFVENKDYVQALGVNAIFERMSRCLYRKYCHWQFRGRAGDIGLTKWKIFGSLTPLLLVVIDLPLYVVEYFAEGLRVNGVTGFTRTCPMPDMAKRA